MSEHLIWVVPLIVAALGAWRPLAGLCALTAALPLFGSSPGGPYLAALDVAAIAAIVTAWRGDRPRPSPLSPAVAAFAAISLISLLPSPYLPPSWQPSMLLELLRALPGAETWSAFFSWRAAADLGIGCALFIAVRRACAGRTARPLALALQVGLAATLVTGLAELAGLLSLDGYRPMSPIDRPDAQRLRSFFFASTRLAEYLVIAAPFALAAAAGATKWARRLNLPLSALTLAGFALCLQRGAWAAAAAQATLFAIATWRRRRLEPAGQMRRTTLAAAAALIVTGSVLVISGVSLEPLHHRVSNLDRGLGTRVPLWKAAVELVRERPLLGQGLGTFAPAYDRLEEAGSAEAIPFSASGHQLYLQVAAERGLLGLLALGLLGGAVILSLRRPRAGEETLALGLQVSFLGVAIYGLVQNLFQLRSNGWLIWILLGCVSLVTHARRSSNVQRVAWALVVAALATLPFRLTSDRPHAYAGSREFGFHELERNSSGSYRWTAGFAARRLSREGKTLILTLANGHPLGAKRPVTAVVRVNGRTAVKKTITGGWQNLRIELESRRGESVLLSLRAEPTFRPFSDYIDYPELPASRDHRELGLALKDPRWE